MHATHRPRALPSIVLARAPLPLLAASAVLAAWAGPAAGAGSTAAAPPAVAFAAAVPQEHARPAVAADHHVHLRSAPMADALMRVQAAVGQEMYEENPGALGAAELVETLDAALGAGLGAGGIRRAVVLSTAYMYGLPELDFENERERVAGENDFVAREAMRYPDRLVGFASVNPLADYAVEEVDRAATLPGIIGLKLHLANSDVDLTDPAQVERLREVFLAAERGGLAIVVHLRTRDPDYGAEQAVTFIDEVLSAAPGIPVQIAHMAGWGGFDAPTAAALGAFAEAIADGRIDGERIVFDLAGVAPSMSRAAAAGVVEDVREGHDHLVAGIRAVGPERVVFGSDWDAIGIAEQVATIAVALPLTPTEVETILSNEAPWFRR